MCRDNIITQCKSIFMDNCKGDVEYVDIDESEHLSVCGMDSFAYVMLYAEIGSIYNIKNKVFSTDLPKRDLTLKELVDFIERNQNTNKDVESE